MKKIIGLWIYCCLLVPIPAIAQQSDAPPALFRSAESIDAELKQKMEEQVGATGWWIEPGARISIRKRSPTVTNYAIIHPYSVEIYYIIEGSGTMVTGGRLNLPLADSHLEDLIRTVHGITGGTARKVSAGDVVILQPGTPHWFQSIDGDGITYMESRIQILSHPMLYQSFD